MFYSKVDAKLTGQALWMENVSAYVLFVWLIKPWLKVPLSDLL